MHQLKGQSSERNNGKEFSKKCEVRRLSSYRPLLYKRRESAPRFDMNSFHVTFSSFLVALLVCVLIKKTRRASHPYSQLRHSCVIADFSNPNMYSISLPFSQEFSKINCIVNEEFFPLSYHKLSQYTTISNSLTFPFLGENGT